eukprot:Skav201450  [mRNA]  locus=scaffold6:237257:238339:+ [translate_table: standard]
MTISRRDRSISHRVPSKNCRLKASCTAQQLMFGGVCPLMARARCPTLSKSVRCLLLFFAASLLRTCPPWCFSPPLKTGTSLRKDVTLSPEEQQLVADISRAGQTKFWNYARSLFGKYTGNASPVYAAALDAAWRCRMNKEGAKIYESCRANCEDIGIPVYMTALRIFGKLRNAAMFQQIWDDALEAHDLDEYLSSARIAAAADAGDVEAARDTLDTMNANNVPINVVHINSAIRACWGREGGHKAAKYFFDLLPTFNLSPTVVSFTSLIGTYSSLSLQEILSAYNAMKGLKIVPNRVFAETLLFTLLQWGKNQRLEEQLRKQSAERLQAARKALDEFKRAGVPLSGACRKVDSELTRMGF